VTAAIGALARLFVAPAAPSEDVAVTLEAALPPAVAIVGRDRRAVAAGCAAGLLLARRCRAGAALVCVRGGDSVGVRRATATLGARRLAGVLSSHNVDAVAVGRLVAVDLGRVGEDGEAATAHARQALGAAGDAPTVLVLVGPREAAFDALLDVQDAIGVASAAGDPPPLTDLAVAGLPDPAVALRCPGAAATAALATKGLAVVPSLAAALAPLIEALP
jgi:hypothetical protein